MASGRRRVPPIMDFIRQLGIDENELIREYQGHLQTRYRVSRRTRPGHSYFHPFGPSGLGPGAISFPFVLAQDVLEGKAARLEEYSIQAVAAEQGRFAPADPCAQTRHRTNISYALQLDNVSQFARQPVLLRRGPRRTADRRARAGCFAASSGTDLSNSVSLESGEEIGADLFNPLQRLSRGADRRGAGYWLRRLESLGRPVIGRWLYTASAPRRPRRSRGSPPVRPPGRWCIPLQHRDGNVDVYSSHFSNEPPGRDTLAAHLDGPPFGEHWRYALHPDGDEKPGTVTAWHWGWRPVSSPAPRRPAFTPHAALRRACGSFPIATLRRLKSNAITAHLISNLGESATSCCFTTAKPSVRTVLESLVRDIAPTETLREKIELFQSHRLGSCARSPICSRS